MWPDEDDSEQSPVSGTQSSSSFESNARPHRLPSYSLQVTGTVTHRREAPEIVPAAQIVHSNESILHRIQIS